MKNMIIKNKLVDNGSKSVIEDLNKLTPVQSECLMCVCYDDDKFVDIGLINIIDNTLVLYGTSEFFMEPFPIDMDYNTEVNTPLTYDDLMRLLSTKKDSIWEIKLCIEHPYFEKKITKLVTDSDKFEDIWGSRPYFI